MITLAHKMQEIHHDYASFVPGFYQGFFRVGYWRWVRYPENFSYKLASGASQYYVHWIDNDIKEETLAARKGGKSFAPGINVYDKWKQ